MATPLALLRPTALLRRLGVRLALVALLAAALMPTFARLASAEGLAGWSSVCQAAAPARSPGHAAALDDACAFCTLAHNSPALLPDAPTAAAVLAYAPPPPAAPAPVRASVARVRAPAARGPPSLV